MTRASSLTLASQLTLSQLSADRLAPFYDEAIYALGALPYLIEATMLDVNANQSIFTFPETTLALLGCWYDSRTLDLMSYADLRAMSPFWQDEQGYPVAYTEENLSLRQFRLYPAPTEPGESRGFDPGGPFGEANPSFHVFTLGTIFQQDLPSWLELPIILNLLAREYALESPHRDAAFAQGCAQLAHMFLTMLQLPTVE